MRRDLDPTLYDEADRREVDPPIEVESATWSQAEPSIGGCANAVSGSVGYAVQMVGDAGLERLIFVVPMASDQASLAFGW
jgi:hypothetical protein